MVVRQNVLKELINYRDQKFPKMQQRPRRIHDLPPASTVQTCLPTCRAVIDTTRSYERDFDAVGINAQVVVRQNVLKELNLTKIQTRHCTRSGAPLPDSSNAATETRSLPLKGHDARVETDAGHACKG